MTNEPAESQFPQTAKGVEELKKTAVEAAGDVANVAAKHSARAKEQIKETAEHATEESQQQLDKIQGSLEDVVAAAHQYFVVRPFFCLGLAFTLGVFLGRNRSARN